MASRTLGCLFVTLLLGVTYAAFTVTPIEFNEGDGTVTITLTKDFVAGVTFNAYTEYGTTDSSDFTAIPSSNQISIGVGTMTATIMVIISDDSDVEIDETFTLVLKNFDVSDSPVVNQIITIKNDDVPKIPLTFDTTVQLMESSTNDGAYTMKISRSDGSTNAFQVTASSVSGTAAGGSDFTIISATIDVAENQVEFTVDITLIDDFIFESDETFIVRLTSDAIQGSPLSITITIADDDASTDYNCNRGTSQPCLNSGVCQSDGSCNCDAAHTVTGIPDCSVQADQTGTSDCDERCGSNGVCFFDGATPQCACKPGHTGPRCLKDTYYVQCQTDGVYVCITPYNSGAYNGEMYANGFSGCSLAAGALAGQSDTCDGYAEKFAYNDDDADCGMVGPVTDADNHINYDIEVLVKYHTNDDLVRTDELVPITCTFDNDGALVYASTNVEATPVTSDLLGKQVRDGVFSPAILSTTIGGAEITSSVYIGDIITVCASVDGSDFAAVTVTNILLNNTKTAGDSKTRVIYDDGCKENAVLLGMPYYQDGNKHTVCASFSAFTFAGDTAPNHLGVVMTVIVTETPSEASLLTCTERRKRSTSGSEQVILGNIFTVAQLSSGDSTKVTDVISQQDLLSGRLTLCETKDWLMPVVIALGVILAFTVGLVIVLGIAVFRRSERRHVKHMPEGPYHH